MHQLMSICPKEVKDSRTENRWYYQIHKPKQLFWPCLQNLLVPKFCLSFFLLKVEKEQHCLILLLLWMLMEDKVLSKDLGLQHLAQVSCTHRATLPLLQGKAGASQMLLLVQESRKWKPKCGLMLRKQQVSFSSPSWLSAPPASVGKKEAELKKPWQCLKLLPD